MHVMNEVLERERREIAVRGIVQGVGFRPFIYSLARRHGLSGWVRNYAEGVQIEVEGLPSELDRFPVRDRNGAPAACRLGGSSWRRSEPCGGNEFRIQQSAAGDRRHALISPDVAVCADCLRELFDPGDRRYRYSFINCTNCGPRFTITRSVPYDRAATTMSGFPMCPACLREYDDPGDRRFHAQPNACPVCGPQVTLRNESGSELAADELDSTGGRSAGERRDNRREGAGRLSPCLQSLRCRGGRPAAGAQGPPGEAVRPHGAHARRGKGALPHWPG